ncbi:hypothetical protein FQA39_LY04150 [Lamprigera yunnana]|nr:hypothetical protein FQA39_LY04150 [Lamprigera yunnana]
MSGGPPHHSHGRQVPSPNTAWNHLQVPNYYPRQPQHAHMSNEHPLLHQATWHTPTTEPVKVMPHSHLFNLEQMISERPFPRHSPGVDLSLQKNGSQNGELPKAPISLSVRDANKINSLPVSAVDLQAVELTKAISPGIKIVNSNSPVLKLFTSSSPSHPLKPPISPNVSSTSVFDRQDSPKGLKRPVKRMDSIIERLNPVLDREKSIDTQSVLDCSEKLSVIVPPLAIPTATEDVAVTRTTTHKEEDVTSPYSNEDSTDSNKSRRKRKPAKTIRVPKEIELEIIKASKSVNIEESSLTLDEVKEQRRSGSAPPGSPTQPPRIRRKTSSESETIANIAAMIEMTDPEKNVESSNLSKSESETKVEISDKPISVSVIKSNDKEESVVATPAQKKMTETNCFVEVENKLEEMFAGITDDNNDSPQISLEYVDSKTLGLEEGKAEESLDKLDENAVSTSQLNDSVTSTSSELNKRTRQKSIKTRRYSESDFSSKKKKGNKKSKMEDGKDRSNSKKSKGKNMNTKLIIKADNVKDVAYDSGSNASSSRSRGPFIQIRGSRESPFSVNVINTSTNDEDSDKKSHKSKKYHDDTEYRHKVRSSGLHCSTLSNKYDAQTRDATWICVFCKRGPHATDPNLSGPSRFNMNVIIPPPGDLFGPYIISTDSPEYRKRIEDPYDQQFKSKKVARAVNAATINKISKKSKRKHSESYDSRSSFEGIETCDMYLGITETQDEVYEVWAHENCIVWSPGVYLVGPKIIGLEEAVWTSCNVVCNYWCKQEPACLKCGSAGCIKCPDLIIYSTRKCVDSCPSGYKVQWSRTLDYMGRICRRTNGVSLETISIVVGVVCGLIISLFIVVSAVIYLKRRRSYLHYIIETNSDVDDSPEKRDFVRQLEGFRPYSKTFLEMLNDTRRQIRELHCEGDNTAASVYKPIIRDLAKILLLLNRPTEMLVVPDDWERLQRWGDKVLNRQKQMNDVAHIQVNQLIKFLQTPSSVPEDYSRAATTMSTFKPDRSLEASPTITGQNVKNLTDNYAPTLNPQWQFNYPVISSKRFSSSEFLPSQWKNSKEYLNNPYLLEDDFLQLGFRPQDEITTEL